jgi:hypothetical protein
MCLFVGAIQFVCPVLSLNCAIQGKNGTDAVVRAGTYVDEPIEHKLAQASYPQHLRHCGKYDG